MQLSSIKEYLKKYQKKLSHEDDQRSIILRVIKTEAGIQLDEKSLTVTKGTVTITAPHVVKNELFLHKERLLEKLKESGRTDIFDIR